MERNRQGREEQRRAFAFSSVSSKEPLEGSSRGVPWNHSSNHRPDHCAEGKQGTLQEVRRAGHWWLEPCCRGILSDGER